MHDRFNLQNLITKSLKTILFFHFFCTWTCVHVMIYMFQLLEHLFDLYNHRSSIFSLVCLSYSLELPILIVSIEYGIGWLSLFLVSFVWHWSIIGAFVSSVITFVCILSCWLVMSDFGRYLNSGVTFIFVCLWSLISWLMCLRGIKTSTVKYGYERSWFSLVFGLQYASLGLESCKILWAICEMLWLVYETLVSILFKTSHGMLKVVDEMIWGHCETLSPNRTNFKEVMEWDPWNHI